MQNSYDGAYKLNALKWSTVAIFSVVAMEVIVGLLVNSLAVLSDGLHALLDAFSSVMLFLALRAAVKPPDEEHTYGHEKFEAIGGLIAGVILIGVAILIFYQSAVRLMANTRVTEGLELVGFLAIGYTLFIDFVRITIFRKAKNIESQSFKAGFYDAISDLSSTIIALLGFGLATLGFSNGDAFASIFLGIMLSYLSIRLARASIMELSDTASKEIIQKTRRLILSNKGIVKTGDLKIRKVSSKIFIDSAIEVSSLMSLEEAHSLASKIEGDLKQAFGNVDATIHIEPSDKETRMEQLIEKQATVEGVKEVHEISTAYTGGKLYVTLHAYVNPELSVEEAHKIAELIESRMHSEIKQLEHVTVHVEPLGIAQSGTDFDENQLKKIVYDTAQKVAGNLQIKRIVTYTAQGKRYINIDCCFTKQVQIKEAHKIASRVEKETKEQFANAVVTVHIEPECA